MLTLLLSSICHKCGKEHKKILMEEESIIILKFFGLIANIEKSQKKYNMPQEKIDKEFRLKKIDEIRNYLIEETNRDELISITTFFKRRVSIIPYQK